MLWTSLWVYYIIILYSGRLNIWHRKNTLIRNRFAVTTNLRERTNGVIIFDSNIIPTYWACDRSPLRAPVAWMPAYGRRLCAIKLKGEWFEYVPLLKMYFHVSYIVTYCHQITIPFHSHKSKYLLYKFIVYYFFIMNFFNS